MTEMSRGGTAGLTVCLRAGEAADLAAVERIQKASPEAAGWKPADYLQHDFRVALWNGQVVGFLVARILAGSECELLNVAVAPECRRRGIARDLVGALLRCFRGPVFLEVRESNRAARNLYKSIGFQEVNKRIGYYSDPPEAAIVMKFHSC